ncbi:MAG: hypothetical protein QY322_03525 [bacterium]|nr:MAG: hypothetical protein QY322_03525 [bacterium]
MRTAIEYIKEALKIYFKKENMAFFIKVMSIPVIFSTLATFLYEYYYPTENYQEFDMSGGLTIFLVLTVVSALLSFWMQASAYFSILEINKNEFEVVKKSLRMLPTFVGVSLVLGLIILSGLLLLIIPAIIFGLWYSFTLFLVFDKSMSLREALKASKLMVKGRMMKVFGRFIVFGLFSIVVTMFVTIIPVAGSLVMGLLSPLFLLSSYLLYKDLLLINNDTSEVVAS